MINGNIIIFIHMSESKIIPIFPINITMNNIGRDFTEDELTCFSKHKKSVKKAISNSFTTNNNILDELELKNIKKFILENLNFYLRKVISPISKDNELYLTESWITKTNKSEHHHTHSHANSVISGVLYLKTINKDSITLYSPHRPRIDISRDNKTKDYNNLEVLVRKGDLILFPSTLMHSVKTNVTDDERVSLAFNSFIKGTISTMLLNQLTLK